MCRESALGERKKLCGPHDNSGVEVAGHRQSLEKRHRTNTVRQDMCDGFGGWCCGLVSQHTID